MNSPSSVKPRQRKRDWGAALFVGTLLLPALLLYGLLVLWPMEQSFWVALHRWRGLSGNMIFVGPENFLRLLEDERFRGALLHNLLFFGMVASAVLVLGLLFANTLAGRFRGVEFFRALFLFPNVVSLVAVSILWMFLYNPNWGLINAVLTGPWQLLKRWGAPASVLQALPHEGVTWLNGPTTLPAVAITYVWYVLGFYVLLFRAGIQNISAEIQEAARVDGATEGARFWHVTLPLLSDIVRLAVIHLVINSMNVFALIWIMAPPNSTAGNTEVALTYLYQKGFVEQQFGYSSAIGAVNFVLVMTATYLLQRFWKTEAA
jgi:ABC-type sugar transport system permease subunit